MGTGSARKRKAAKRNQYQAGGRPHPTPSNEGLDPSFYYPKDQETLDRERRQIPPQPRLRTSDETPTQKRRRQHQESVVSRWGDMTEDERDDARRKYFGGA